MPRLTEGSIALNAEKPDSLRNLYAAGMSQNDIARKFNTSSTAVFRYMLKHGISARTNGESQSVVNRRRMGDLTASQEQLLLGSLLGDACLHRSELVSNKTGISRHIFKLHFAHTEKMLPYLLAKHALLGLGVKTGRPTSIFTRTSGFGSTMRSFTFSHTPTLERYAGICLNSGGYKYVTREWCDLLTWEGVAWWYQDDGTLACRDKRRGQLILCTDSFSTEELENLCSALRRLSGNRPLIRHHATSARGVKQYRLFYDTTEHINQFIHAVYPYIHESMLYKTRWKGPAYAY